MQKYLTKKEQTPEPVDGDLDMDSDREAEMDSDREDPQRKHSDME